MDFPRLLERVGGDRKALAQLVRIFRADSPNQVARIRKAIRESDAPALRSAAHAVKGAVSNFAAASATEAAARLQRMGDTGHLAGAEGCARHGWSGRSAGSRGAGRRLPPAAAREAGRPEAPGDRARAAAPPPGLSRVRRADPPWPG